MTEVPTPPAHIAAQLIRDFIANYDRNDREDRWIARRLRTALYKELYRRERDYPEWVDFGGEAG